MPFDQQTPGIDEPLNPEERDKLIDELASRIVNRRLETAAILFLEMNKPISFVASQGMLVASPLLVPLFGQGGVRRYSQLFSSTDNIERLIERIEDLSEARDIEDKRRKAGESARSDEND